MGSMESLDDGSLRQMTLGSSSIHRAITMLCPLDVPGSANPQPAELLVLRLQSKGAQDVSHKADVASLLIQGGRVSAHHQKKIITSLHQYHCINIITSLHQPFEDILQIASVSSLFFSLHQQKYLSHNKKQITGHNGHHVSYCVQFLSQTTLLKTTQRFPSLTVLFMQTILKSMVYFWRTYSTQF